jgi:hypothetical protein
VLPRGVLVSSFVAALLLLTGVPAFAQSAPNNSLVVDAFERTRSGNDLDGALAQFNDDAVVTIQSGRTTQVFAGRDQVRAYLTGVASSRALMRSTYEIDGAFVRWTERDEDPSQTFDATMQATIQNGRISTLLVQQTQGFAAPATPRGSVAPRQTPSLAWALGLGSALTLCLGLVFRPRQRSSQSRLDGRLVNGMRSYHGTRV